MLLWLWALAKPRAARAASCSFGAAGGPTGSILRTTRPATRSAGNRTRPLPCISTGVRARRGRRSSSTTKKRQPESTRELFYGAFFWPAPHPCRRAPAACTGLDIPDREAFSGAPQLNATSLRCARTIRGAALGDSGTVILHGQLARRERRARRC